MNEKSIKPSLQITPITIQYEEEARQLILAGLKERFGFLNSSYNLDLLNIIQNYSQGGDVFLIGLQNNNVVCTGALIIENSNTARIQRMSVKKSYRRAGLAKSMIQALEMRAGRAGCEYVILETNNDWQSAIEFYKNRGYQLERKDEERSHFLKQLEI